jgi:hypothetical protein
MNLLKKLILVVACLWTIIWLVEILVQAPSRTDTAHTALLFYIWYNVTKE